MKFLSRSSTCHTSATGGVHVSYDGGNTWAADVDNKDIVGGDDVPTVVRRVDCRGSSGKSADFRCIATQWGHTFFRSMQPATTTTTTTPYPYQIKWTKTNAPAGDWIDVSCNKAATHCVAAGYSIINTALEVDSVNFHTIIIYVSLFIVFSSESFYGSTVHPQSSTTSRIAPPLTNRKHCSVHSESLIPPRPRQLENDGWGSNVDRGEAQWRFLGWGFLHDKLCILGRRHPCCHLPDHGLLCHRLLLRQRFVFYNHNIYYYLFSLHLSF
jgi:hypothetical protein